MARFKSMWTVPLLGPGLWSTDWMWFYADFPPRDTFCDFFAQRRNLVPSFSIMVAFTGCVSELMTQLAETCKAADRVVTACVMYLSPGCLSRRLSKKKCLPGQFFRETFTIRVGPLFKKAYLALIVKESSNKVAAVAAAAANRWSKSQRAFEGNPFIII